MHVYYVEHSFARPDPSATLGEIATRFSFLDYGILRFELAQFSVSTLFPSKIFPSTSNFQHDTKVITFTLQIGSAYKTELSQESRHNKGARSNIMDDMIKLFFLIKIYFRGETIFKNGLHFMAWTHP